MSKDPIIFIPAAGRGSRVDSGHTRLPKPLLSIGNLPLIAHIMNSYPYGSRFHVAVGFKADYVRQVVELFSQLRGDTVTFSETHSWEVENKGLSHTLLDSEDFLQEPFIFHAVDSLIVDSSFERFRDIEGSYALHCRPLDEGIYRVLSSDGWVRESVSQESKSVYIGVSKISDHNAFWKQVQSIADHRPEDGETIGLIPHETRVIDLDPKSWLDVGHEKGLARARRLFTIDDIVLERHNEAIWSYENSMYKFHEDASFITNRVFRGRCLTPFVPKPTAMSENIYTYNRVPGITLSGSPVESFGAFLGWIKNFWNDSLSIETLGTRHNEYFEFYRTKTYERVEAYLSQLESDYIVREINGKSVRSITDLLSSVDWEAIAKPKLVRAHGDLHPENIIFDSHSESFSLLDWRQDLAGFTDEYGDLYYDLGKILHGLLLDHHIVREGQFSSSRTDTVASWKIMQNQKKRLWEMDFRKFVVSNGYDWQRVKLLSSLIFLNIAVLHEPGYRDFLFIYGHNALEDSLSYSGSI